MKTIKLNRETIIVGSVAATALLIGGGFAMAGVFSPNLKDKVQAEFPNTPITSVSCDKGPANLCEAVAGQNVFYVRIREPRRPSSRSTSSWIRRSSMSKSSVT